MNINVNTETLRQVASGNGGLKQTAEATAVSGQHVGALSGKISAAMQSPYNAMLEEQLQKIGNRIQRHAVQMDDLGNTLNTVADNYDETERAMVELLQQ